MSRRPLRPEERDLLAWIGRAEKQAVLPLRIAMLLLTALIWLWSHAWALPPSPVFVLFFVYAMSIVFAAYCLLLDRLDLRQMYWFCLSSLIVDALFVAGLFHLDHVQGGRGGLASDYYVFFFLVILRGFAILQRDRDLLLMNAVVLIVFVTLFLAHQPDPLRLSPMAVRELSVRTALIILVMGLSWFLMGTLSRMRTELLAVRERLLRSENLATLGEIVAGVAHEINNPVGIISAYADFLMRKAGDRKELAEDFEVIRAEAKRCEQIVGQLLSFANPHPARPEPIDLAALNDEVVRFLFLDKRNNLIDISTQVAPGLPHAWGEPVQIKQALLNLYMNARSAMGEQGEIQVSISEDAEVRGFVRLEIRDSGPGIPEEALASIFEPFFTTKAKGTGLGLAITRRVIEAHGGTIVASNAPAGGAAFTIRLPSVKGP